MQFSTVLVALFANMAMASPLLQERSIVCGSELDTPLCCEIDVAGVIEVCQSPSTEPLTVDGFQKTCSSNGKTAQCCTLDVDDVAVLCANP